jgi:hypothetical protein
MTDTPSERRLAENETVFRNQNEKLKANIQETNRLADEDNQPEYKIPTDQLDSPLSFYCECADEKCTKRVEITLNEYDKIHLSKKRFVILPGHEVPSIERTIKKEDRYSVVEKFAAPPEGSNHLNPSSLQNNYS